VTVTERYAWLRARHRCVGCTKRLPAEWRKARCRKCLAEQLGSERSKREFLRDLAKRVESLEAWVRSLLIPVEQSRQIVKENNTVGGG